MLLRNLLVAALCTIAVLAAPIPTRAAAAGDVTRSAAPEDSEGRRTAYQIGAGVGVGLVGYLGAGMLLLNPDDNDLEVKHFVLAGSVLATTVAVGWVSCLVGRTSPRYTGYCNGATAGAFIGMLPMFLGTGACVMVDGSDACYTAALATMSIVPSLGAAIGWHAYKRPREPQTSTLSLMRPEDPAMARRRGGGPAQALTLPLVSLRF